MVDVAIAFGAGLLSFLSPCVVPLVPAYVTYITGMSAEEVGEARASEVLPSAVAFVLGLALVLSGFGLGVTALGQVLSEHTMLMTRVGGVLVIVLGLHTSGLLRIAVLQRSARMNFVQFRGRGPAGAFLMGGAFGMGWTPCVGAILGGIVALASQSETLAQGTLLLFVYSLGLGVPFILVALGIKRAVALLGAVKQHLRAVELASGVLLVATGVLLFTDRLNLLTGWFVQRFGMGFAA